MNVDLATDNLLEELGIGGGGSGTATATVTVKSSSSVPVPPPPPPPAATKASTVSLKVKKSPNDAQKEIDELFDSVISFAGKTSTKKKTPPPVAPKPKRKIHVSSYTMQVKSAGGGEPPSKAKKEPPSVPKPPSPAKPPSAPAPPPAPSVLHQKVVATATKDTQVEDREVDLAGGIVPAVQQPVAMVAFGPGLETFEVNCFGDFQVSCPHDTDTDDLEVVVTGPSGTKPVEIDAHGNGQFSCSYLPTVAGDHTVSIKVKGQHIPGSPFTAHVQFASYTDKCSAEGPGLVSGSTEEPCHFTIRCKEDAGYARMRIHIVGPSKAEPVEMVENPEDHSVGVTYHPSAPGDYTIRVLWGEAHVHGSPFTVPVTGTAINDPSRVKVTGKGLEGGDVGEPLKIFIEGEAGAGPGPLGVRMVGPSKPDIKADASSDEGVEVIIVCRDPGEYQLILKWGSDEVPSSPWTIKVKGEGRTVKPELCTASGEGTSRGEVGKPACFTVKIPDEAGPGSLGVSVSGPHPPKPIEIQNNEDGTMQVTYHPIAPGDYKIDVMWANQHISGSPFTATVSGKAVRNAKNVFASGEILSGSGMKCNQLGTISVEPKEGAGAGPLRAKLEGPSKADLQLSRNEDGTMLVSFIPKDHGSYKLHLLWGDDEAAENEIYGSPFLIKVEKN